MRQLYLSYFLLLSATCTTLIGCDSHENPNHRREYWAAEVESNLRDSRDTEDLISWLVSKNIEGAEKITLNKSNQMRVELEEIQGDGLVCKSWVIQLSVAADELGQIENYEVNQFGVCL